MARGLEAGAMRFERCECRAATWSARSIRPQEEWLGQAFIRIWMMLLLVIEGRCTCLRPAARAGARVRAPPVEVGLHAPHGHVSYRLCDECDDHAEHGLAEVSHVALSNLRVAHNADEEEELG